MSAYLDTCRQCGWRFENYDAEPNCCVGCAADSARAVKPTQRAEDTPRWFVDRQYALAFCQMTDRTRDALLTFGLERPDLQVEESFSSRYYLGMYGSSNDPQTVVVEMWPYDAAFPRSGRTYAQLNNAPERELAEMLREIEEGLPTPSAWMAL